MVNPTEIVHSLDSSGNIISPRKEDGHGSSSGNPSFVNLDTREVLFSYATPTDSSVVSGTSVTIDPVLNSESNVIDSGWIDTDGYGGGQFFNIVSNVSWSVYILNASDTSGNNMVGDDFAVLTTTANIPATTGAPFFDNYYRIVLVNTSGSTATEISAFSVGQDTAPTPTYNSINQNLQDFFPAPLTRSVTVGRQPDGDYNNTPADGVLFENTTLLTTSQTFTSDWFDTDGYKSVEIYIATDQVSATDGVVIEFTNDTSAGTPTVYPGPKFTYSSSDVTNGFMIKRFSPALDGFRIKYTNGGTNQGSFFISGTLRNSQTEPQSVSVENDVDSTLQSLSVRGSLFAKNDAGNYGNITRGDSGGLRASINEYEAETPVKPLDGIEGTASSFDAVTKVVDSAAIPVGTKSIQLQAGGKNQKKVYFATSSANATASAAIFELDAGQAQVLELGEGLQNDIWAGPESGTQRVRVLYIKDSTSP